MTFHIFLSVALLLDLFFCFLITRRGYTRRVAVPAILLTFVAPVAALAGSRLFLLPISGENLFFVKAYFVLLLFQTWFLLELATSFMGGATAAPDKRRLLWVGRGGVLVAVPVMVGGVVAAPVQLGLDQVLVLSRLGTAAYCLQFALALLVLYLLEGTFRSAEPYQRKFGRLVFASMGTMAVFQIVFHTRGLLYRTLTESYVQAGAVVYSVCLVMLLLGLTRYRLATEKVAVPRDFIYSSVTLFLVGAFLLGLGGSVFLVQRLGFVFTQFEVFLVIFSVSFFMVLLITSGDMRKRIMRVANGLLYQLKHDYREQFFRLHRVYTSTGAMERTVTELIDNLQYALMVQDVYVFLVNSQDGNYYIHANAESATPTDAVIHGHSPLVQVLEQDSSEIDLAAKADRDGRAAKALEGEGELVRRLHISLVFPIVHEKRLLGILAIRNQRNKPLDEEDREFVRVFALSIGSVFFKHHMLQELVEHKQFESFNHVASFIIHDIKNQVATLTLLTKNAGANMDNPEFQKSLVKSVTSTAGNLQHLVEKLAAPPSEDRITLVPENVNNVVKDVTENAGLQALKGVTCEILLESTRDVLLDRRSLFYIVKNLVVNAMEAMRQPGTLTIRTGDASTMPEELRTELGIGEHLLAGKKVFILVQDTGAGMSRDYMETRLFRPFSSTKDKGVGIGLYQCKTLVERMNGKLLCASQVNVGTKFGILL